MTKLLKILSMAGLFTLTFLSGMAQDCSDSMEGSFTATTENRMINWDQFGEIDLPFTLVYGGPTFNNDFTQPLRHGFTHLSNYNIFQSIPPSQRALIYYGTGYVNQNQPFETIRSPWGNDIDLYIEKWKNDHSRFANGLVEQSGKIEADIIMFDIGRQWRTDFEILQLKTNPLIESQYKNLSNSDFLSTYKRDLKTMYTGPLEQFRQIGYGANTKVSSYSDAPIYNTFDNILGNSWQQWQQEPRVLNHLLRDGENGVGGSFENELDFMAPSAYYYYDYPHPFAGEYLSYLLFQIESNRAWTTKPIIPFVWLRYSFNPDFQNKNIKPWMAEATAIFPFFSGANGLWLWDNPANFDKEENFNNYEYFLKGLKRLSEFKSMFEGDFELVIEQSARDLNEQKKAIWRGLAKDNFLLVAAHNPFAKNADEVTNVEFTYKGALRSITLIGYETKLCLYDLSSLGVLESEIDFKVFPNPTIGSITIDIESKSTDEIKLHLVNMKGQVLLEKIVQPLVGQNRITLEIPSNMEEKVLLRGIQGSKKFSKSIVITP